MESITREETPGVVAPDLYDPEVMRNEPRCFLFLQGPHGSFYKEFGKRLERIGYKTRYICLNGGDFVDKPLGRCSALFTGRREVWGTFFLKYVRREGVTDIFLYGDKRFYHTSAIQICKANGIRVWVFEEGYLRPGYVTLEKNGVNGKSVIPHLYNQTVEKYLNRKSGQDLKEIIGEDGSARLAPNPMINRYRTTMRNMIGMFFFAPLFPFYVWHREQSIMYEFSSWLYKSAKEFLLRSDNASEIDLILSRKFQYFVFPMQLSSDYQIKCSSSFRDVSESIECVIHSFARCANEKDHLVIKLHPFENSYFNYRKFVRDLSESYGVGDRVHFIVNIDSNQLVQQSKGMVVINSTMGIVSLKFHKPTITLGNCIYSGYGLAVSAVRNGVFHEESLDRFWTSPTPVNADCLKIFFSLLKKHALVLGNFYTREGVSQLVDSTMTRLGFGGIANCIIFSKGIRKIPNLNLFLDSVDRKAVVGWGHKKTAFAARNYASIKELPYYALEDGLIKSVSSGYRSDDEEILSLVLDRKGIYYDASCPSSLEELMVDSAWFDEDCRETAEELIMVIVDNRIVKYNVTLAPKPDCAPDLPDEKRDRRVLLIDQTRDDASISLGNASARTFERMLREAIDKFGKENVFVREHPNVTSGLAKGYFSKDDLQKAGVNVITAHMASIDLLLKFSEVYVVTSGTGFEALMCGCRVTCFGEPFYSGYGLTVDMQTSVRARRMDTMKRKATLQLLVAAVFCRYSIFVNPKLHRICAPMEAIQYIIARKKAAANQEETGLVPKPSSNA
ncbi:MAG: hypothetical protein IJ523_01180 [Succinivibrionaceae bacterium]|nr:hypothetical protein [Succinivibrionaceae bacterium]